jgi:ribosomal-protein-alanine N-acetyltransferase
MGVPMRVTTERLVLREFEESDWPAVLAYQSDPRYLRFYPPSDRSPADVRAFVSQQLVRRDERPRMAFQLVIVHQADDRLIGNCGLRRQAGKTGQADLGYEVDPRFWGRGYATEAARALLAFGFDRLGLHRVWSRCIAENVASARVLEKLGMRLEGRLRDDEWFKDRWWDTLIYGILEHEWRRPPTGVPGG